MYQYQIDVLLFHVVRAVGGRMLCGKCFRNIHPLRRSAVELNHLNARADNPGLMKFKNAEKLGIDAYISQLRKGKGDAICKYCHEVHYTNPDTN